MIKENETAIIAKLTADEIKMFYSVRTKYILGGMLLGIAISMILYNLPTTTVVKVS